MAGRPLTVYTTNPDGTTTVSTKWRCPRGFRAPTPCIGCTAQKRECEASMLFKGTIREPGYESIE
jgi:hypothetical protein